MNAPLIIHEYQLYEKFMFNYMVIICIVLNTIGQRMFTYK